MFSRRPKTIKKPSFLKSVMSCFAVIVAICLLVLFIFQYYIFSAIETPQVEVFDDVAKMERLYESYYSSGDETIREEALEAARTLFDFGVTVQYEIDGNTMVDTTDSYSILYSDGINPPVRYFGKWDESQEEGFTNAYEYLSKTTDYTGYFLHPRDLYIDDENGIVYPGVSDVMHVGLRELFVYTETCPIVDTIDLTPDESVLANTRHVIVADEDVMFLASGIPSTGMSAHGNGEWYTNSGIGVYNHDGSPHSYARYINMDVAINTSNLYTKVALVTLLVAIVILSLFTGTIKYIKDKSVYSIFEYRRKTTEAMAHDLKTPLAVISLSAANLKEQLLNDPQKCIKHADEIEDSVQYTSQIIEDILEFSKSEISGRKLKLEEVNIRNEINSYVKSIESTLFSSSMSVEVDGEASIKTDLALWTQAINNLISNCVKYGVDGGSIEIKITAFSANNLPISGSTLLTITNPVNEDIPNAKKLLEPFVKGDTSRGENSGSGLGLAIADNNLHSLGFKLEVKCENKQFIARIRHL